jgi:hypothetical protein
MIMDPHSGHGNSGDDAERRAEELSTLKYWLANEDVYTSNYVRKWLERTPSKEAADTLDTIAQYAGPEPHSLWWMLFHGLTAMLTTAEIISEKSPAGRKAGIRAATLLAGLHDPRALPLLIRAFETHWFWEGKYQVAIESALLRFFSEAPADLDLTPYREHLQKLADRIWQIGRGRTELTSRKADLLIALLHRLAPMNGEAVTALLQTIVTSEARTPQRNRVKLAAIAL